MARADRTQAFYGKRLKLTGRWSLYLSKVSHYIYIIFSIKTKKYLNKKRGE